MTLLLSAARVSHTKRLAKKGSASQWPQARHRHLLHLRSTGLQVVCPSLYRGASLPGQRGDCADRALREDGQIARETGSGSARTSVLRDGRNRTVKISVENKQDHTKLQSTLC